jgi:N-acetylneuraminic acid mutarotase
MKPQRHLVKGLTSIRTFMSAGLLVTVQLAILAHASAQTSGTWTNTGSLNTARADHTTTLLPNGQVLVAGGENAVGVLASAELYSPSTGQWMVTGNMTTPRINHKATLLRNGEVLVSGGNNSTGALASAELYNPSTDHWTSTGSMTIARTQHGATLLNNGKVLVAGGNNSAGSGGNTTELYDPTRGTWKATGSMQNFHLFTVTLLQDGRALAVDDSGDVNQPGEIYNPSTGQWTVTGEMYYAHSGDAVALLPNGNVLAYGNHFACYAGQFFNPNTNTWSRTVGQCGTGISFGPVALLGTGKALLAGGSIIYSGKSSTVTHADLYDPSGNNWTATGALNQARSSHTLIRLQNGQALAAGGFTKNSTGTTFLTSAELYTP